MNKRMYPITEEFFKENIEPEINKYKNKTGRRPVVSNYKFFNAVLYVLRTGISWRDVPAEYGSWHTIYTRFKRWSGKGILDNLLENMQQKQIKADTAWVDSTAVPIHRHGSGAVKKSKAFNRQGQKGSWEQNTFNIIE